MIIDYEDRWSVCTPTKCGTYSLEGTLIDRAQVAYKHVPRHDWDGGIGDRILVVRNPFDRWASMYWFMVQEAGKGIWLQDYVDTIDEFVEQWSACSPPDLQRMMWHSDLTTYAEKFKPDRVFKMEDDYERVLEYLRSRYAMTLPRMSRRNTTRGRRSTTETLAMMSQASREKVLSFCSRDAEKFGYPA